MISTLKKEDLINYFEELFFSKNTKRIDFCLTAKNHDDDNKKFKEINMKSKMFKDLKREEYPMNQFKNKNKFYDDLIKSDWIKNREDT